MKIGAVVLAAGGSARLGQPKQLLLYRGESLVRRSADAALQAGCTPVVIVLGWNREKIAGALHNLPVALLPNDDWESGIGRSLRGGVRAVEDVDAVVILACDQPYVDASLVHRLIEAHERTGQPIVACTYCGTLGVPALFARAHFSELLSLPDEQGAKAIIAAHPAGVARVDFPEGAIDIDTLEDYRNLPNEA